MAVRFDSAELRPMTKDPITGFFRGEATISKVGVFPYLRNGKIVRELRHPKDVFDPHSLASAEAAPVTIGHPPTRRGIFESPDDTKDAQIGAVATPTRDGNTVKTTILLTHTDGIEAVETRKIREISPGYLSEFDPTPGVYEGQAYDGRQFNIRYNHFAILEHGRQGPDVGIRLDAEDAYALPETTTTEEPPMAETTKVRIDQADYEIPTIVAPHVQAAVVKMQARCDGLEAELVKLRDAAKAAPATSAAHLARVVQAHALFAGTEAADLDKLVRTDSAGLERLMLKHLSPEVKLDGLEDSYVRGRLDLALEMRAKEAGDEAKGNASLEALAAALGKPKKPSEGAGARTDGADGVVEAKKGADKAYADMIEERRKRGAQPLVPTTV